MPRCLRNGVNWWRATAEATLPIQSFDKIDVLILAQIDACRIGVRSIGVGAMQVEHTGLYGRDDHRNFLAGSEIGRRISVGRRVLRDKNDEIEEYWGRLDPDSAKDDPEPRQLLLIESHEAPCVVGFAVNKVNRCPLFRIEPTLSNIDELLAIIKRAASFRKAQRAEKRNANMPKNTAPPRSNLALTRRRRHGHPINEALDRLESEIAQAPADRGSWGAPEDVTVRCCRTWSAAMASPLLIRTAILLRASPHAFRRRIKTLSAAHAPLAENERL
jgi:hypothetical protein